MTELERRPRQAGGEAWRDLGLTLGPVEVRRVGLSYAQGRLFVLVDASLAVGPAQLALAGLGFGIDSRFTVSPTLRGAGLQMDKPPVRVTGVLERRVDPKYAEWLTGMAAVETGFFALHAMGSYARSRDGWSSMFLFGEVGGSGDRGLFGPPVFTVMAVCLGFGVNSRIRDPRIDEVRDFPLVQRISGGAGGTPEEVLESLAGPGGWVTPRAGEYWGAGGLEFSSFRFLEARALLLVHGGPTWQVCLIGRTTLDLPRNKAARRPLARLVVDLAIAYHGEHNRFSMDAVLAPGSYVLDPAAELSGGLALYIWGSDRTASGGGKGFVFTVGGYHRDFQPPGYYPRVPRVGWRWSRGPVTISGEAYLAITDGAFMAGGRLEAVYDNGHGINLRAWFTAWVDALVRWKPFSFSLSMGLSVGVSATVKVVFVRVRVSLEVGVSLDLWGPPIGGRARVKVWFISFTIGIGSGRDEAPLPGWDEFRVQLPAAVAVVPQRGLLADVDAAETEARKATKAPQLVSADGFTVATESVVPASKITLNGALLEGAEKDRITIRPMGYRDVVSEHRVTVHRYDSVYHPKDNDWSVTVVRRGVPRALWGDPGTSPERAMREDGVISGCLSGIRFQVPAPRREGELGPVRGEALEVDELPRAAIPLQERDPAGPRAEADPDSVATISDPDGGIGADDTAGRRTALYDGLAALGVAPGGNAPLGAYASRASTLFTDPPLITAASGR
ncbi:DUF6603 domain-containing protein [Streptoalloteichus hindustanus]|uniref:DUF6603 domain-containing protein n=1 Tax=Streptoalloteichus hindustanus TaxID=2017 RepID=A0A1M5M891_STRHI|nr:DUF6603 domain-containing protein [Streptoalloteichus hindustanus]SHG73023.1 hypothetical protein SAMN05444320_11313 [Streptoalloteichus hindustanus]